MILSWSPSWECCRQKKYNYITKKIHSNVYKNNNSSAYINSMRSTAMVIFWVKDIFWVKYIFRLNGITILRTVNIDTNIGPLPNHLIKKIKRANINTANWYEENQKSCNAYMSWRPKISIELNLIGYSKHHTWNYTSILWY